MIVTIELTGAEILQALTRSAKGGREDENGGFLNAIFVSRAVPARLDFY